VLCDDKSSEQIEVYDVDSFRLLHCLTVPGLGNGGDIVVCGHNRCAYIGDWKHDSVHRVALSGNRVTQWPVSNEPACLSLSVTHGVLVTCMDEGHGQINEFSTDGQLLHELTLSHDIVSPWHTIQLSSGEFIVSHGDEEDSLHRVCLIGSDGRVVKSFGGPAGFGSQQMVVDRNGFAYIVDVNNGRVLLLSPVLTYVREVVSRQQLRWDPLTIHLLR